MMLQTSMCCCYDLCLPLTVSSCVVADSRGGQTNWAGIVRGPKIGAGKNKLRAERAIEKEKPLVGFFFHTYWTQRSGTQSLEKKSLLSDVECPQRRQRAWPGSRHASRCTEGPLACLAAKSARQNLRTPESGMLKRTFMLYIETYRVYYLLVCIYIIHPISVNSLVSLSTRCPPSTKWTLTLGTLSFLTVRTSRYHTT